MFCYSLPWWFSDWIFPASFPVRRNLPGELGRIGRATGEEAIFAKDCFISRVAGWSPKTEDRSRFLMDCLALLDFVSWSVNPQVVGSSPTRGAMKKPLAKASGFFNEIRSFGTSEIAFGSEILLRNVKCASHIEERILFHFLRKQKIS